MRFTKHPDAVKDYTFDWTAWLGDDTIATATITTQAGLTVDSQSKTATTATVWLSGGTKGQLYTVTCRITTTGGRTDLQSFQVKL